MVKIAAWVALAAAVASTGCGDAAEPIAGEGSAYTADGGAGAVDDCTPASDFGCTVVCEVPPTSGPTYAWQLDTCTTGIAPHEMACREPYTGTLPCAPTGSDPVLGTIYTCSVDPWCGHPPTNDGAAP